MWVAEAAVLLNDRDWLEMCKVCHSLLFLAEAGDKTEFQWKDLKQIKM